MDMGDEVDFVEPSTSKELDDQIEEQSKLTNATQSNLEMNKWAKRQGLTPQDLCCGHDWVNCSSTDWAECEFDTRPELAATNPRRFYYSSKWAHAHALQQMARFTAVARESAPNAGVGANFVPYDFVDEPWKWVDAFRAGALTMPWAEGYIWGSAGLGTQQMAGLRQDFFRAGVRHMTPMPGSLHGKIMYYIMPHTPGQCPSSWRRLFYSSLIHGVRAVAVYELHPAWTADVNYADGSFPGIYEEVLRSMNEYGQVDDVVLRSDVQAQLGEVGLFASSAGGIWRDTGHAPQSGGSRHNPAVPNNAFGAAKRALYIALLHLQLSVDIIVDADVLDGTLDKYSVLYLTDMHVERETSAALRDWVGRGGTLYGTAGAGSRFETDEPNDVLSGLFGVQCTGLTRSKPDGSTLTWIKRDLPYETALDRVQLHDADDSVPVFSVVCNSTATATDARVDVLGAFASDGRPAITSRTYDKGAAMFSAFLPGLSYMAPAIPRRPIDESSNASSFDHFVPTAFSDAALRTIALPEAMGLSIARRVNASDRLVEVGLFTGNSEPSNGTTLAAILCINWRMEASAGVEIEVAAGALPPVLGRARMASSGEPVRASRAPRGGWRFALPAPLAVADAVVIGASQAPRALKTDCGGSSLEYVSWYSAYEYYHNESRLDQAPNRTFASLQMDRNLTFLESSHRELGLPGMINLRKSKWAERIWNYPGSAAEVLADTRHPHPPPMLLSGWEAAVDEATATLLPLTQGQSPAIKMVMLGDELLEGGFPLSNLSALAARVRHGMGNSVMIYTNMAFAVGGACKTSADCKHPNRQVCRARTCDAKPLPYLPPDIDVVSSDQYAAGAREAQITEHYYNRFLFPLLRPHQRVWVCPGLFGPPGNASQMEATDSELVEKLQAYWAFSKRDKRVAGLIGWHWSTLYPTFAASMRLGAREFPLTKRLVAEIVGCLQ